MGALAPLWGPSSGQTVEAVGRDRALRNDPTQHQVVDGGDLVAATHSLKYFFTGVTAGIDLPEFTAVGLVDDEPLEYYDSNMKSVIPKTEWLEKSEEQQYWDERTQRAHHFQQTFKAYNKILMRRFNQTQAPLLTARQASRCIRSISDPGGLITLKNFATIDLGFAASMGLGANAQCALSMWSSLEGSRFSCDLSSPSKNVIMAVPSSEPSGVHVFQRMCGCEWDDETGITDVFNNYGYDGEDFLFFDLKNTRWISPSPQGVSTALEWNYFPAHLEYSKSTLTQECIEALKKYVSYGTSTLERTVAPEVSLLQKDPSSPVVCHVTGFFPRVIMVTWQKKGEDHYDDVEWGETLPNEDGTFQTTSRLTVKDWQTEDYTCIVEHKSLEKDIVKRVIERKIRRNQDIESE
ncbi:hypothetical protein AAFF_G00388430 [Aldrovandia affinis]|uniref:Ig-like domain-containing protein n=1 Tax=Aldrovandia affinis TaxID=143900 RepID=A0AAD7VZA8_9TELE|nr:hypothetical protein AAFF_G00388430 [Aldrovandia affinis]